MKYINVIDTAYKGFDISVWEHEDHTATCDIKKPNGELIEGRTEFKDVVSAGRWAIEFIDNDDPIRFKGTVKEFFESSAKLVEEKA